MPRTGRPPRAASTSGAHHRGEPGDGAAAQVVAVREAAGQHDGVDAVQVRVAVPERDRVTAGPPYRPGRVTVVERPREGDDPDPHQRPASASSARSGPAARTLTTSSMTGFDSSVVGSLADLGQHGVGHLAVDLELEPLALADPGEPVERRAAAGHRRRPALRVEDLGLRA